MNKDVKQNAFFAVFALVLMGLSVFVFYPLSMNSEQDGGFAMISATLLFYITQALSLILSIAVIGKGLSLLKSQKHYLVYLPFLVGLLLMIGFLLEFYWVVKRIP